MNVVIFGKGLGKPRQLNLSGGVALCAAALVAGSLCCAAFAGLPLKNPVRIPDGKMNLDLAATGGSVMVISQFTLMGDASRGRRPSFINAAPPAAAEPLYEHFVARLRAAGVSVATGRFGADMQVRLVNDGPVTMILERNSE